MFRLALRQTEGLIGSVLQLLGLDLPVPDHSTLSRRAKMLWRCRDQRRGGRAVAVLVHKSAVGRGSAAAIAVYQAMRCDTGMPSRVIRLSAEQATRASVFWLGRVRARRPRPMMVLYRNTAVSPSERLP